VLRFTDRASSVVTAGSALARLMRTQIAPRLLPLLLRIRKGRAFGFRTLSQLAIHNRNSAAVQESPGAPRAGPRAGDRLPDARIVRGGRESSLHRALAAPAFHLLLCGPATGWPDDRVVALRKRHGALVAVHRLTRDAPAPPGVLLDPSGEALVRLGVVEAAQYLVRPDGHIGYRSRGTDTLGAERYLARWLSAAG
jgi:hypothetical protein